MKNLKELNKKELKLKCKELGISKSGSKEEIFNRIQLFLKSNVPSQSSFERVVNKLREGYQGNSIPCKVNLLEDESLHIFVGWNCPDKLLYAIDMVLDGMKFETMAESSGYNYIKSTNVGGGVRSW